MNARAEHCSPGGRAVPTRWARSRICDDPLYLTAFVEAGEQDGPS